MEEICNGMGNGHELQAAVPPPRPAASHGKTNHQEHRDLRTFYRKVLRHVLLSLRAHREGKAKVRKRIYSVMLSYPPWANRRYLYSVAHEFAARIATVDGDGIWLVADTRPCPEADCQRLYDRLRREDEPPLGFHWHGLVYTSRAPERIRDLWINYSGAAIKPTWVKEVTGRAGEWDFANSLSRLVLYHSKEPPHLGLPLEYRTVASGLFKRLWRKATGWPPADPSLDPFVDAPTCGDPSVRKTEERAPETLTDDSGPSGLEQRRCGCGCGASISHRARHAHFLNAAHRMRAKRGRKALSVSEPSAVAKAEVEAEKENPP